MPTLASTVPPIVNNADTSTLVSETLRALFLVWADFEMALNNVPLLDKLQRQKFQLEDYHALLINLRQQVIEGSGWISRAASSMQGEYKELRSRLLKHAVTEHRDYELLELDYVSTGGTLSEIQSASKNIGSLAFSAYMYNKASQPNPIGLLGAMFVIEGLGQHKALQWGRDIQEQLQLDASQVRFLTYHGENDPQHMNEFHDILSEPGLLTPEVATDIVQTAKVVARLYRLQLEEIGVY